MARRLEKDALAGAFARGPKPELGFLIPEKAKKKPAAPAKGRRRKRGEPAAEAALETPAAEPVAETVAVEAAPAETAPVAETVRGEPVTVDTVTVEVRAVEAPPPVEPVRPLAVPRAETVWGWTPAATPLSRKGLRARLERGWDGLVRRLLEGALRLA